MVDAQLEELQAARILRLGRPVKSNDLGQRPRSGSEAQRTRTLRTGPPTPFSRHQVTQEQSPIPGRLNAESRYRWSPVSTRHRQACTSMVDR